MFRMTVESDDWNELINKTYSQEEEIRQYKKLIEQLCEAIDKLCLFDLKAKDIVAYVKARSIVG